MSGDDKIMVSVRGLTMRFGRKTVHQDLDLDVHRGEILGIVGGSGCGKTTLLREMALLQEPTEGTVRVLGEDVAGLNEAQRMRIRSAITSSRFPSSAMIGMYLASSSIRIGSTLARS